MAISKTKQFLVCVNNDGYAASLENRKIYVAMPDAAAEREGLVRVIDESGSGYLYPGSMFCSIDLPAPVKRAVLAAA